MMDPVRNECAAKRLHPCMVVLAAACLAVAALVYSRPLLAQQSTLFLPLLSDQDVAPAVETVVTPAEGGTVRYDNGRLELVVGPGMVTEPLRVTLRAIEHTPPPGMVSAGLTVEISFVTLQGKPVTQLAGYATLRISTREIDRARITPETVQLFHEKASGEWEPLIDRQQADLDVIEAWVSEFSAFGLFGKSTLRAVRGLATGTDDSIYWYNEEDAAIYRRTREGTWLKHHQKQVPFQLSFLFQRTNNLVLDRATGSLYVVADNALLKIDAKGNETTLYAAAQEFNERLSAVAVDAATGALYLATENSILRLDPASGAPIGRPISALEYHKYTALAADGKGRLLVLAHDFERSRGRMLPDIQEWHTLYVVDLRAATPRAQPVAAGFVAGRGLAVDAAGTVYVANEGANVISVLSGEPLAPVGRMESAAPWALALSADGAALWSAAYAGGLPESRAIGYRDEALAEDPTFMDGDGSVSGLGSTVTVRLAELDPVPAHQALALGDTPITEVCRIDVAAKRLVYCLPDIWTTFPTTRPDMWSEFPLKGAYRFAAAGLAPVAGGTPIFPESSTFRRWPPTSPLVRGEWLVWSGDNVTRVRSLTGLFADWTPESGSWLAVQMPALGTFGFEVTDAAGSKEQRSVTVVAEAPTEQDNRWIVQPGPGATLRGGGAVITIPPGALPGSQTYTVSLDIRPTEPLQGLGEYSGFSNRYRVLFLPEPARLNNRVTIRLPFDPVALAGRPVGSIYDNALGDYTPIQHRVGADYVEIILPAGEYRAPEGTSGAAAVSGSEAADEAFGEDAGAAIWPAADTPANPTGEKPLNAVNTVTKGLWWVTGLANAQWESEHFIVRYHGDKYTGGYAESYIQALEEAYLAFEAAGFTVPASKTIARITPLIPDKVDGFAPKVGTLGHWYLYVNDGHDAGKVKAVAAHELFHIVQNSTMSTGGRATAPTWWLEATAVWAEKLAFGKEGVVEYREKIRTGCSFANRSLVEYADSEYGGGLNEEEQYGATALAIYLEEQHSGAVLRVFQDIGWLTSVYAAMEGVVGDMPEFYEEFALAFWGQDYADAKEWDLGACVNIQYLDRAANVVVDKTGLPALSSEATKVYVKPGSSIPGVGGTSGSVLRMALVGARSVVFLLEGKAPPLEPVNGLAPFNVTEDNEGRYLDFKLSDRTAANPIYFIAMNRGTAGASERMRVVLEAPIISICSAPGAKAKQETIVSISGEGFGPVVGSVSSGSVISWSETAVQMKFTPFSAGNYGVRVQHANAALSNVCTIVVE